MCSRSLPVLLVPAPTITPGSTQAIVRCGTFAFSQIFAGYVILIGEREMKTSCNGYHSVSTKLISG